MSQRTLLLTTWYFPIQVLRWQDAVKMIYEQTVDVVAEYDEQIRSPSTTWNTPAVVRLRRDIAKQKKGIKFSRLNVYQRDRFTCQYCGKKFSWSDLTYDHLVPRSRGGRTSFENIIAACKPCNSRKGDLTCDEAGMFPRQRPFRPKALPLAVPMVDTAGAPPEWEPYLAPFLAT